MYSRVLTFAAAAVFAVSSPTARAGDIGWRSDTVTVADGTRVPVAFWYPTDSAGRMRTTALGPFEVRAAIGAPEAASFRGLVVVSHGTGGSELGQGRIAEALAARGYLAVALRHPGDNYQDQSLLTRTPERYFDERPRQVSRLLDALLADPSLRARIASDARGPRIGAVGHSAGGFTVIALAGGRPSRERIVAHCGQHAAEDPVFCSMGRRDRPDGAGAGAAATAGSASMPAVSPPPSVADPRIRAVAALAPVGVVFDAESLAGIRIPAAVWVADRDRWLVPRFHGEWIARNLPANALHHVPNAWHFAFMDTPSMPIPTPDGDIAADPPGFDRAAFLARLGPALADYFDASLAAER